jgi:hypothetical protein
VIVQRFENWLAARGKKASAAQPVSPAAPGRG